MNTKIIDTCSSRCLALLALLAAVLVAGAARAASPAPLAARDGMVVTESPVATLAGAEILARGGTAIDAAVAVSFALAVTYPQAGNLGGGGFLLYRSADGASEAIDFREVAPAAARSDLFLGPDGRADPRLSTATLFGTGVPGSVAGMALALERHGTMRWEDVVAPAWRLADQGFTLDRAVAAHLAAFSTRLGSDPESRRVLLREGRLYQEGEVLRQEDLAATLYRLMEEGPREFYEGKTARLLVEEMRSGGGIMTANDLLAYRPRVRDCLEGSYRGLTILTMPPPSSGGIALLQMLRLLEPYPVPRMGPASSRSAHLLAEVMKRAFAARAEYLADADFIPVPVAGLLSRAYLDSLGAGIDTSRASGGVRAGRPAGAGAFFAALAAGEGKDGTGTKANVKAGEGRQTTHFSIVDRLGNAVAVTTTLNTSYGTGIMVRGAGFLLNNEMDDFAAAPNTPNAYGLIQSPANAVRPFARPLSSMTPTFVLQGDTLRLVLGSPGGPMIINSVLQALINVVDHGMNVQESVDAPRIHHQWMPDSLFVEPRALSADTAERLRAMGHALREEREIGSVQAIEVRQEGGVRLFLGGSDSRANGCAAGVNGTRVVSRCGVREMPSAGPLLRSERGCPTCGRSADRKRP